MSSSTPSAARFVFVIVYYDDDPTVCLRTPVCGAVVIIAAVAFVLFCFVCIWKCVNVCWGLFVENNREWTEAKITVGALVMSWKLKRRRQSNSDLSSFHLKSSFDATFWGVTDWVAGCLLAWPKLVVNNGCLRTDVLQTKRRKRNDSNPNEKCKHHKKEAIKNTNVEKLF